MELHRIINPSSIKTSGGFHYLWLPSRFAGHRKRLPSLKHLPLMVPNYVQTLRSVSFDAGQHIYDHHVAPLKARESCEKIAVYFACDSSARTDSLLYSTYPWCIEAGTEVSMVPNRELVVWCWKSAGFEGDMSGYELALCSPIVSMPLSGSTLESFS